MFYSEPLSAKTLGFSVRKVNTLVGYSSLYEFEDFIGTVSNFDLLEVQDFKSIDRSRKVFKTLRKFDKSGRLSQLLAPSFIPERSRFYLDKKYDFLIYTFNSVFELFLFRSVQGWQDKARHKACFINELWEAELKDSDYLIELAKDFDHIFVGLHHCVETVTRLTGKPCTYLPLGVDALKFNPFITPAKPSGIDICNIGRRSEITHKVLQELAHRNNWFYYYDTISAKSVVDPALHITFHVKDHQEHRALYSNLLKRSRYFIANRAMVNRFKSESGKDEIPARYFEGCAAGTIMLGEPPNNPVFRDYFGWEDAVIAAPFDAPHIGDIITELEAQPERLATIQRNNVIHALRQHDWLHRLRTIYNAFDLPYTPAMEERAAQINALVDQVHRSGASEAALYAT
ncbi:MAG: glycosyltransferase [Spirulina sp.]